MPNAIQIVDYFTDANGTLFTNHTPLVGGKPSWAYGLQESATAQIESNLLVSSANGYSYYAYYSANQPVVYSYDIIFGLNVTSIVTTFDFAGIFFAVQAPNLTNFYRLLYQNSSGVNHFSLQEDLAGVATGLVAFGGSYTGSKLFLAQIRNTTAGLQVIVYDITNGGNTLLLNYTITNPLITGIGNVGANVNSNDSGGPSTLHAFPMTCFAQMNPASILPIIVPINVTNELFTIFNNSPSWDSGTTFTVYGPPGFTLNSVSNITPNCQQLNITTSSNQGPIFIEGSDGSCGVIQIVASVPISYTIQGPTGGSLNAPSNLFVIASSLPVTDNLSISSSNLSDIITPSTFSPSNLSLAGTFSINGSSLGERIITVTSSNSYPINTSPFPYFVATPFTISGPLVIYQGVPVNILYTPLSNVSDVVTPNGGSYSPTSLTFSSSNVPQSSTYTANTSGQIVLSATSTNVAQFNNLVVNSYAIVVDANVSTSGKLIKFETNSSYLKQNNNYIPEYISAVNNTPIVKVNGNIVQIGPVVWENTCNFVTYLLECGSVEFLNFSNAGTFNYTNMSVVWNNDGGGTSLILGTPVTAVGIIKYNIVNEGTAYTKSFLIQIPGGINHQPAMALVNVVDNVVVSVVPADGSSLAYGTGYSGTLNNVTLNGSAALGYNFASASVSSVPVPGSGLVVNCVIGSYGQTVPVISSSGDFTSPPTFTITDTGSGTGATIVPVMSGPAFSDNVTYSVPANWLATPNGFAPPANNALVNNSVGKLEGPVGHSLGYTDPPTMLAGGNLGYFPSYYAYNMYSTVKNKLKGSNPWLLNFNSLSKDFTLDSTYYPAFWTPNSWISSIFYNLQGDSGTSFAQPQGHWNYQYNDDYYNNGSANPQFTTIFNNGASSHFTPVNGPFETLPVPGAIVIDNTGGVGSIAISNGGSGLQGVLVTINGLGNSAAFVGIITDGVLTSLVKICNGHGYQQSSTTVTLTTTSVVGDVVTITFNASFNALNSGGNLALSLEMVSNADGIQHIHNPAVFAPGNSVDRSDPLATDDNVLASLANIGTIRGMEALGGALCPFMVDANDIMDYNLYSWSLPYCFNNNTVAGPPHSPIFAGTTVAGSPIITNIPDTSILIPGLPMTGNGIPGSFSTGQAHILSVDSSSQITISYAAKLTGVQQLSVNSTPSGQVTFTSYRFYNTNPASSTYPWSSPFIYSSEENIGISGTDSLGSYFDIRNGPLGANDNGLYTMGGGAPSNEIGIIELISPIAHNLKTSNVTGTNGTRWFSTFNFTATLISGSPILTGMTVGGIIVVLGQIISGPGIPSGTIVSSVINSTSVILSNPVTISGVNTLTTHATINWNISGNQRWDLDTLTFGGMWVTGPKSVAFRTEMPASGGNILQYPVGTVESPIFLQFQLGASAMSLPYQYFIHMAEQLGCVAHLNIPYTGNNGLSTAIGQIAAEQNPDGEIDLEVGNEPWNFVNEYIYQVQLANLMKYYPPNISIYPHYNPAGEVVSYVTNGSAIQYGNQGIMALRAANKEYIFKQAFAANGGDPSKVKLMYNCQYGAPNSVSNLVAAVKTFQLTQGLIATAPYYNNSNNITFLNAARPAGYTSNPGNWPVSAINDFYGYYVCGSASFSYFWVDLNNIIEGTTFQLVGYEGGTSTILQNVGPFSDQKSQDCLYDSSYYNLLWRLFVSYQRGGLKRFNYFSLYWNTLVGFMWKLADGADQPIGQGFNNLFITPQGGFPGIGNLNGYSQSNESPGLYAISKWGAMINKSSPSVVVTGPFRLWHPGFKTQ